LLLAALCVTGCAWTEFDDLADTTWVRSTDEANVGSRDYALAIAGVTTDPSGGRLAVVSGDLPDFSTLEYAADGTDKVGANDVKLGQHRIAVLSEPPLLTTDGAGKIAMAERSTTGGNIAVVFGPATAPAGLEFAAPAAPDAVAFTGADIVVAAGNTFYTLQTAAQVPCMNMDTSFAVAAMAADASTLWVWSKAGAFFGIPIASLAPCNGGMLPAAGSMVMTAGLMPAPGARVHIVGNRAVLTGHPTSSRMSSVFVVDLSNLTITDTFAIEGVQSSTLATFGTATHVILGIPDTPVDGVVAGTVEAHVLDTTTGMITRAAATTLHDAQAESGQLFGRAVTTMKFNDQQILVIAGKSEVFAYYKTALYDALP
jgi:hypothetical protein